MKRDWDCIKVILRALSERDDETAAISWGEVAELAKSTEDVAMEHLRLLAEAGFIETHPPTRPLLARRLTWAGHDLLETLSSRELWPRIKQAARDKGIGLTLDSIGWLAKHVAEQLLD